MTRRASRIRPPAVALPILFLTACGGSGPAPAFSVGGTISGLAAAGLTLANGADAVLPAASSTSFSFPSPVASGTSYAVTVGTQPAGQTCVVAGGSGTVASANVLTVAVTCTAKTYFVGGTITGLTAAGLSLASGGDTVSPARNVNSFAFPTHLTAGSAYGVSVTRQPKGLQCLVTNGSGTVAADVSNITITCRAVLLSGWSGPEQIGIGEYPAIASIPGVVASSVNGRGNSAAEHTSVAQISLSVGTVGSEQAGVQEYLLIGSQYSPDIAETPPGRGVRAPGSRPGGRHIRVAASAAKFAA